MLQTPETHDEPFNGQVSSMLPLQLSSTLLQVSAVGVPAVALQTKPVPSPLQTQTPERRHAPTPTVHDVPFNGQVSSIVPLQLLSWLSQSSVVGITSPAQVPHEPAVQVCVPGLQIPTPAVPAAPV
jgi:hypothetical protein